MDKKKQSFIVDYSGLKSEKVKETYKAKSKKVVGQSFVIDWSDSRYKKHKKQFEELSTKLAVIFGNLFVPQKKHHSTVLSKTLDRTDINNNLEGLRLSLTYWSDGSYEYSQRFLKGLGSPKFSLTLDKAVIADSGTIQLVFRNEETLPLVRLVLKGLGAQVKSGTIEDDFINTCTVVLGYLKVKKGVTEKMIEEAASELRKWGCSKKGLKIDIHSIKLVEYYDLSLKKPKPRLIELF